MRSIDLNKDEVQLPFCNVTIVAAGPRGDAAAAAAAPAIGLRGDAAAAAVAENSATKRKGKC